MKRHEAVCRMILAASFAVLGAAWSAASEPGEQAGKPVLVELTIGRVLHVNTNYSYVILQCGSLPSTDEEAKVCRGNAVVARLRINSAARFPFVAADVIEGQPQEGDSVKQVTKKYARSPNDERRE